MRQIAETIYPVSPPEIIRLLPKPTKDVPLKWISGEVIEAEEKAKIEEKRLKELKKKEKLEKKQNAIALKREKAEKKKRKSEGIPEPQVEPEETAVPSSSSAEEVKEATVEEAKSTTDVDVPTPTSNVSEVTSDKVSDSVPPPINNTVEETK